MTLAVVHQHFASEVLKQIRQLSMFAIFIMLSCSFSQKRLVVQAINHQHMHSLLLQ